MVLLQSAPKKQTLPQLRQQRSLVWGITLRTNANVLPPVYFDVPANQERYSRARVMDESEHIRRLIQDALYDMFRTRRSVWFG